MIRLLHTVITVGLRHAEQENTQIGNRRGTGWDRRRDKVLEYVGTNCRVVEIICLHAECVDDNGKSVGEFQHRSFPCRVGYCPLYRATLLVYIASHFVQRTPNTRELTLPYPSTHPCCVGV